MFKFSFPKFKGLSRIGARELVGIDFTGDILKIAQINIALNRAELASAASRDISGFSDDETGKAVKEALGAMKLKNPSVISVLPSHVVITKNIEVPSIEPKEIREIIGLQAGRHTPYSREEIIVDYIDIGTYKNNYTRILLVIVARSLIKKQFQIMDKTGFRLERLVLSAEALAASLQRVLKIESQDPPISILHVDAGFSDFIVVFKNKPIFIRSIPIGTQYLASERDKYEARILEELRGSYEAYQSEAIEKNPDMLILTGATEELKYLEDSLNASLHLPVRSLSLFKIMTLSEEAQNTINSAKRHSFLDIVASLLALDRVRINLIPEEVKLRKTIEDRGRDLIKTGIFILLNFVIIFFIFLSNIYFKAGYLKKLESRFGTLSSETRELEKGFTRISLIKNYLFNRGYSLEVLTELYSVASTDLQLSDIRFDQQGKFSVAGTAESMSAVFAFVENMEKSPFFKEVKTRYTAQRKQDLKDLTDFEVVATLTKKGKEK